jgi:hypothetical protein
MYVRKTGPPDRDSSSAVGGAFVGKFELRKSSMQKPESAKELARRIGLERIFNCRRPLAPTLATDNYSEKLRLRMILGEWIADRNCSFFITINTNDSSMSLEHSRLALKRLGAFLDHYFLGKKWQNFASSDRTFFVAVPERAGDEWHFHLFLKLPHKSPYVSAPSLRHVIQAALKEKHIFPHGDVDVRRLRRKRAITNDYHQLRAASYALKRMWRFDGSTDFILSTEFHKALEKR